MWPFDSFNNLSPLINEYNLASQIKETLLLEKKSKIVFLVKWYGYTDEEKEAEKKKEIALMELIDKIEFIKFSYTKETELIVDKLLEYKLKTLMPRQCGDITIDILGKIIQASLIICDITPMNLAKLRSGAESAPNFNANAMFELGLAMAWKMPEQVIAIYDKEFTLDEYKLPFDIQNYFATKVNFDNLSDSNVCELGKYIAGRISDFNLKKEVLFKDVASKLDDVSLSFLIRESHGLIFPRRNNDIGTIRHLESLNILKTETFPNGDYGYYLTDFGRLLLYTKFDAVSKLLPKEFCELIRISYWVGHGGDKFERMKKEYCLEFNRDWENDYNKLRSLLIKVGIKEEIKKETITMFNEYQAQDADLFKRLMPQIITPWIQK